MTISNGYCTVEEFKAELFRSNPNAQADSADDGAMERHIEGVSRAIDRIKNRRFWAPDDEAEDYEDEVKYYTADSTRRVKILDDLLSLTTLKTDFDGDGVFETTWTAADYQLWPGNGGVDERPWLEVHTRPSGVQQFPAHLDAVQVTGKFGFCAVTPAYITQACILGAIRTWKRPTIPFGVSGKAELGTLQIVAQLKKDGEFMLLLDSAPTKVVT